ncbi:hypothetical protein K7W42_00595 [Deinococcus sp. HMF7604]|uniref:hypothetical protein n=1 Tax=Deinococcus betulae TaxID=2873312 RepID=UPI001CCF6512|nr:hypothetical protein [Deinococcus betulae]MBZ9749349.1 hypothetical protein [Deinococcus betulae]
MDLDPDRLSLPDDRFVFEMTDKGFAPARVTLNGQAFDLMFFDPIRAGQELRDLDQLGVACTGENNVVLVLDVTVERLLHSVRHLRDHGYFLRTRPTVEPSAFEVHLPLDPTTEP